MTAELPEGEVLLDTLPVDHGFLTTLLRQQKLAFEQQLAFMDRERVTTLARIAQLDAALALRAAELDVIEAHNLAKDLRNV